MARCPNREMATPQKPAPKPTKGQIIVAVVVGVLFLACMLYVIEKW